MTNKKIALVIKLAHRIREESFNTMTLSSFDMTWAECWEQASKGLIEEHFWRVLLLANQDYNMLADWAEYILQNTQDIKEITDDTSKEDTQKAKKTS